MNFKIDKKNHGYKKNGTEMCLTHSERKSVIAVRFIRTLKIIYKYTTSVLKNVYIDKLDDIVNTLYLKYC